jgi:hypothetical protein
MVSAILNLPCVGQWKPVVSPVRESSSAGELQIGQTRVLGSSILLEANDNHPQAKQDNKKSDNSIHISWQVATDVFGLLILAASVGYEEPSLVFLAGTCTHFTDATGAADFLRRGGLVLSSPLG